MQRPSLRRVMFVLGIVASLLVSARLQAQEATEIPIINSMASNKFVMFPTGAVQQGDANKGPSVILVRGKPGCGVPWHWHTPNEQVMLVSGTARIQMKDGKPAVLRPGAFAFMPSHHVHRFNCLTACVGFVRSDATFDIHYVDEGGKEIRPEGALKGGNKGVQHSK